MSWMRLSPMEQVSGQPRACQVEGLRAESPSETTLAASRSRATEAVVAQPKIGGRVLEGVPKVGIE